VAEDDGKQLGETVSDLEASSPLEQLSDSDLLSELGELMVLLDARERRILSARFGLEGESPKTLEEVGRKFGVTRERIRQLQNGALSKLRRALQRREKPLVYPG
jgi:RNA polymerase primary sigma factor